MVNDFKKWIEEILHHLPEDRLILASAEDAEYFRTLVKQNKGIAPSPPPPTPKPEPRLQQALVIEKKLPPTPAPHIRAPVEIPQPKIIPVAETQFSSSWLKALFGKIAPEIPLIDPIPSDDMAKKIATRWKTKNQIAPISILYSSESPEQKSLLTDIAHALDVYFGPAKLIYADPIEKENQWEIFLSTQDLKWVVVCDSTLWRLSALLRFYKEIPLQNCRLLKEIPLFLLPDLSLYLKDPLLKSSLWNALCTKISS